MLLSTPCQRYICNVICIEVMQSGIASKNWFFCGLLSGPAKLKTFYFLHRNLPCHIYKFAE
uniref:Uncharacterized protein n=1 Tax=Arundo donax TaxID=35708 RepID=A0A0A9AFY0_ARUDO